MVCDNVEVYDCQVMKQVLILLFLEYGLRPDYDGYQFDNISLNPTFSGIWSATGKIGTTTIIIEVLILLFLEYGLRR